VDSSEVAPPIRRSRKVAALLASAAFLVLIAGISYFAIIAFTVRTTSGPERATAYRELGLFLNGQLDWYRDARVYGAGALLLALLSLLFGVHPLARITLPVAGAAYVLLHLYGEQLRDLLARWALQD